MAFQQQPLLQSEYTMKIIKDLGKTTASTTATNLARYAIFECTMCNAHFKARASGAAAKKQLSCVECTKSADQFCKHPLYAIWNGIKQRCYSPKRKDYFRYGGVGVTMCDEWRDDVGAFITWCITNGWNSALVVDKDIKSAALSIAPAIYSPDTISFITVQQNAEYANAKVVEQYSLSGEFIQEFPSTVKAGQHVGCSKSSIAACCRGITKTSKGFVWKYKN